MKVFLLRIGQTEANNKEILTNNSKLSEEGIEQVKQLKKRIIEEKFDKIITSEYSPSIHTAEILFEESTQKSNIDKRFNEVDWGLWEGLQKSAIKLKWESE